MSKSKTRKKAKQPTNEQKRRQIARTLRQNRNLESYKNMVDIIEKAEAEYAAQVAEE